MSRIACALVAALVAGLAALASPTVARAQRNHRVDVTVVDVAGGRAYLSPGESAGVRQGSTINFGRRRFRVVAATATFAVVELGRATLERGDEGRVVTAEESHEPENGAPRPLSAFEGQWPAATRPADGQHPRSVPLGVSGAERRYDMVFTASAGGIVPTSGPAEAIFRGDLRAQVYAEPFDAAPAWFRGDLSLQGWVAGGDIAMRQGGDARPWLQVRELAIGYGSESATDFFGALGRIRAAATNVGQLDGLRLRTPSFGGVTVGAFGGFVPNPLSGIPDFQTSRFGVELGYRDYASSLMPTVNLVAYGSLYKGALDERRALLQVSLFPGSFRVGAAAEVSLYDEGNPWVAVPLELSSASVDGGYRIGNFDIGVRADMRKPERSRWLADMLPPSWLCSLLPFASPRQDCSGKDDSRYLGSVDLGLRVDDVVFRGGGTYLQYVGDATLTQLGGYLSARANRIVTDRVRADVFLSANIGALIDSYAGRVGTNVVILPDMLDVGLHYRLSYNAFRASDGFFLQHAFGGTVNVRPLPDLLVMILGEGITSADYDVVMLSLNVAYRPAI